MRLDLIRHLPVRLPPGRCYGRSDVAAEAPDAAALTTLRASLPGDVHVASSPLSRCADLARRLVPATAAPHFDARWQEIDFGDWELRDWDDIPRRDLDAWAAAPWAYRPPQGESAEAMCRRVLAALGDLLAAPPLHAVIVTHGGPLRVLLGHLLQWPRHRWLDAGGPPGTLVRLSLDPARRTARVRSRGHLPSNPQPSPQPR